LAHRPSGSITAQDFITGERESIVENPTYHRINIRSAKGGKLVTVIELLSLANKKGIGLAKYRRKREMLIDDEINLVEIDLLRAGTPPAVDPEWPQSAYRVQIVNPALGTTDFWAIDLDEQLPTIGIPLLPTDDAVPLDLQASFEDTYYYGMYANALDYDLTKLQPRVSDEEQVMIQHYLS
jgi:hypothetical protein